MCFYMKNYSPYGVCSIILLKTSSDTLFSKKTLFLLETVKMFFYYHTGDGEKNKKEIFFNHSLFDDDFKSNSQGSGSSSCR